jgi:hypothetical protein
VGVVNIGSGVGTRVLEFVQQLAGDEVRVIAEQERQPTCLVANTEQLYGILDVSA